MRASPAGRARGLPPLAILFSCLACAGARPASPARPEESAQAPGRQPAEAYSPAPDEPGWVWLLDGSTLVAAQDDEAAPARLPTGWESIDYGGEGPVEVVAGGLRLGMGSMLTGIRRTDGDALPSEDYELEVVAARLAGTDFFCGLTFPVGDSFATLVLGGWGGALTGLSCLDGLDASDNETRSYRSYGRGRDTTARVRVTRERVQAWVDGESVADVARAGRRIDLRVEVVKSRPLGISSYATVARVRSVRLRRLAPGG